MLIVALANHPFMNNLTLKIRGESVGRLPEGQTSRAIYLGADPPSEDYDALQQQSTDDQSEVNQVQSLLSENTPPPAVDESQFNDGCDSEQQPWNVDTDASDGLPPATSSVHTTSSVEVILGTSDEPLVAAEVAVQTRPQRSRGRPAGVKNKPKTKVEAAPRARRQVQKRAREAQLVSSDSDTFDLKTPIVVHIQKNVRANEPPPPKKTRRTNATTTANITTVEEGHEHIEQQRQRGVIIRNFSTDLESFFNHLNDQDAVSGLYTLLNTKS